MSDDPLAYPVTLAGVITEFRAADFVTFSVQVQAEDADGQRRVVAAAVAPDLEEARRTYAGFAESFKREASGEVIIGPAGDPRPGRVLTPKPRSGQR